MIITNWRYALVGCFITSYLTRAHGIIVIYLFQLSEVLRTSSVGATHTKRAASSVQDLAVELVKTGVSLIL